jgi:DNA-binding NtrC family response regulator
MRDGRILIVDDNKGILTALQILLQPVFSTVGTLSNPNVLLNDLASGEYDLVLLDMNFKAGINTGNEGLYWLGEIKKRFPAIEVVMITAYGDIELAVKALREGAVDFVLKPWDNEKLVATLQSALKLSKSNQEIKRLRNRENHLKSEAVRYQPIIGLKSASMKSIIQVIQKISSTEANVLITGENGTGKEIIAKEIHRLSKRQDELFVQVDLSSLTETLFESELFGHKKGSFTNAYEDRTGRFVLANKGTLFLDEIGNITPPLQSKLLTVLQTRQVTPVGTEKAIPVDIRLISATNKNLNQMIAAGLFREDLLYRMNTIQIQLPPLRERIEDIEELVSYFLEMYILKYGKKGLTISDEAMDKIRKNSWPGNIRQLQHAIEKAVILGEKDALKASDFFMPDEYITEIQPVTLDEMERHMIMNALKKNSGNQSATADQLGITRQTLYNKLRKYDI